MDVMTRIQTEELEERARLADVIDRRSEDIVKTWVAKVSEYAAAKHASVTDLKDGIHDYLSALSQLLRSDQALDSVGAAAWVDVARGHALTRVRLGFDVSELTQELVLLRRVTSEVIKQEGIGNTRQVELLLQLIDDAMKSTLRSYIDFRDYQSRRVEAEHIGFLTHELKNPLGSAVLAVDQLRHRDLAQPERKLCDILERNLERIRRMIDDALLTERLEIGEVESKPIDVNLRQLIGDSIATFEWHATQKQIGFASDYDPSLVLHVDPHLTLSAVENLLDNAIKFTDTGTVKFMVQEGTDQIVFHVRDQCTGLSEEELRVIFEPFKRVHSGKPGTGLGLAIARRAVEAQGGTMHAESSPDAGCHFWFALPKTHH
jgi:signal transduction histidine kinase